MLPEQGVELHPLEHFVHVERSVPVVEPHHEAERDDVGLERIHEGPAERRAGSGQPSVCITASRGRFVSQISFTPSAKICGFVPVTPCHSRYACASIPRVPSASTVTLATRSFAAMKFASGCPSRPKPVGAVRTPATRVPTASRLAAGKPVNRFTPSASAFPPSQRTISHNEAT